jgi:DNA polymerase III subunit delta
MIARAKKYHLTLTKQAADHLAFAVEGNLLAAAQEIEKLHLLSPDTPIDHHMIDTMVTDNAHFDVFHLVDSALLGDAGRAWRITQQLAAEGVEPTLVLWAFTREIRALTDIHRKRAQGAPLQSVLAQFRIWEKRQPCVRAFLQRHTLTDCLTLLVIAGKVDRVIKGSEMGNPWEELENLILMIASDGIIKELSLEK